MAWWYHFETENGNSISGNLLNLLRDFLNERKQRGVLNGQFSAWKMSMLEYGKVPYSVLYCFWFKSMIWQKLFADGMALFSVIHDIQTSANKSNKDLERISNWATQWKMNSDTIKEAQEVISSCKLKKMFILYYCLIMPALLGHLPKNTWELYLTIS